MNDVLSLPQDESFFAGLYQHQAATLRHLLLNGVTHYTLFWEMGCGRTPVAARLDWGTLLSGQAGPLLYLCPAVCAATRLLERYALRWCEVLSAMSVTVIRSQDEPRPDRTDPFSGRNWREIATRCCEFPHHLDAWELEFIGGSQRFPRLNPKQATKLSEIAQRLLGESVA